LDTELSSEQDWISLGKLTSLQRLDLDLIRPKVTDAYIAHLSGLQSLKSLSVSSVVVTDKGAVVSLEITDEGFAHLSKLTSLERLTLHGAKITDEGLQHLEHLRSLRWLDLQGCKVTEQGLQQLKKKLPALRWYL